MQEEMASQEAKNSWEVFNSPEGVKLLDTKWFCKVKWSVDGSVDRNRSLVFESYLQGEGTECVETFVAVCQCESIRLLLNIAPTQNHYIQFDVKTEFLHGNLKEEIYVKFLKSIVVPGAGKVLRLLKIIDGLKQSPRSWNEKISDCRSQFGSFPSKHEHIVAMEVIVAVYIDDGPKFSSDEDLGIDGIRSRPDITRGTPSVEVTTENLLGKIDMTNCNPSSCAPVQFYTELEVYPEVNETSNVFPCRHHSWTLILLAKFTVISYAVSRFARIMIGNDVSYWKAAKNLFRHFKSTSGRKEEARLRSFLGEINFQHQLPTHFIVDNERHRSETQIYYRPNAKKYGDCGNNAQV